MKAAAAAGSFGMTSTVNALTSRRQESNGYFGVHPFIENHPEAVFIMRTGVEDKNDSAAKLSAGLDFGRSVIVPRTQEDGGVPLTSLIPVKPNLTCRGRWDSLWTEEKTKSVVTDSYFVEGILNAIMELGVEGSQFYIREVNCPEDFEMDGFGNPFEEERGGVAGRIGAHLDDMTPEVGVLDEELIVWSEVPDPVYFIRIPHLWPVNAPDSWLLNVAKFKAHGMGVTMTVKNLQGCVVHNYQRFGNGYRYIDTRREDRTDQSLITIQNYYNNHVDTIPRWDKPGTSFNSGIGMETWVNMTLDNHGALKPGFNVVEGIVARDGNGFARGPGPDGLSQEFLTNIIMFGMNPFHIDNIGHWLGGHEPGNFGLFHIAAERNFADTLNPHEIPVYEWFPDGTAQLTPLDSFERTQLMTYYLQRDYDGQNEDYYHLCDEPFEYPATQVHEQVKPSAIVLHQNYPNPFNPYTSIEYSIPRAGNTRLEIFNVEGQLVDVLVDSVVMPGSHMAVWNTGNHASGTYFYRLQFESFTEMKKMVLLK